ncbi:MAG: helix-turn-helix domain-containing protein, partial [Eggerthellaceae bacterium]|nr:helix-turn-helix domain-containing protein [Eggerthellaceae bacterium]
TVDDMAELLDTSTRTIYRLCDRDELPYRKVGRRLYFPKKSVIETLQL